IKRRKARTHRATSALRRTSHRAAPRTSHRTSHRTPHFAPRVRAFRTPHLAPQESFSVPHNNVYSPPRVSWRRRMKGRRFVNLGAASLVLVLAAGGFAVLSQNLAAQGRGGQAPRLDVDPLWPRPFPVEKK